MRVIQQEKTIKATVLKANYIAQIRINPVFLTAKTAICLMARAVQSFVAWDSKTIRDTDTILGNAIVVEAKYRTICRLIEYCGYHICVEKLCI